MLNTSMQSSNHEIKIYQLKSKLQLIHINICIVLPHVIYKYVSEVSDYTGGCCNIYCHARILSVTKNV